MAEMEERKEKHPRILDEYTEKLLQECMELEPKYSAIIGVKAVGERMMLGLALRDRIDKMKARIELYEQENEKRKGERNGPSDQNGLLSGQHDKDH